MRLLVTHNLLYSASDHNTSLSGRVTFDDAHTPSSDNWPNGSTFDTNFITDLTFTYTSSGVSQPLLIQISILLKLCLEWILLTRL